jgi:hypothetical protein
LALHPVVDLQPCSKPLDLDERGCPFLNKFAKGASDGVALQ